MGQPSTSKRKYYWHILSDSSNEVPLTKHITASYLHNLAITDPGFKLPYPGSKGHYLRSISRPLSPRSYLTKTSLALIAHIALSQGQENTHTGINQLISQFSQDTPKEQLQTKIALLKVGKKSQNLPLEGDLKPFNKALSFFRKRYRTLIHEITTNFDTKSTLEGNGDILWNPTKLLVQAQLSSQSKTKSLRFQTLLSKYVHIASIIEKGSPLSANEKFYFDQLSQIMLRELSRQTISQDLTIFSGDKVEDKRGKSTFNLLYENSQSLRYFVEQTAQIDSTSWQLTCKHIDTVKQFLEARNPAIKITQQGGLLSDGEKASNGVNPQDSRLRPIHNPLSQEDVFISTTPTIKPISDMLPSPQPVPVVIKSTTPHAIAIDPSTVPTPIKTLHTATIELSKPTIPKDYLFLEFKHYLQENHGKDVIHLDMMKEGYLTNLYTLMDVNNMKTSLTKEFELYSIFNFLLNTVYYSPSPRQLTKSDYDQCLSRAITDNQIAVNILFQYTGSEPHTSSPKMVETFKVLRNHIDCARFGEIDVPIMDIDGLRTAFRVFSDQQYPLNSNHAQFIGQFSSLLKIQRADLTYKHSFSSQYSVKSARGSQPGSSGIVYH
ncbi:MAG: hypothetical protein IPP74_09905 [Alphaproteobacteria bacterium]|nr:hypothetical protein [Alphaproteobacteria bacterium]